MENYIIRLGTPLINLPVDLILGYLVSLCALLLSTRFHEIGHWFMVKKYDKSAKPHIHQYWIYGFTYTDDIDTNGSTKLGYFQQLQERIDSYRNNKAQIPEQLCKEIIDNAEAGTISQRKYLIFLFIFTSLFCYFFPSVLTFYMVLTSIFIVCPLPSSSDKMAIECPENYFYNHSNSTKKSLRYVLISLFVSILAPLFCFIAWFFWFLIKTLCLSINIEPR